MNELTIKEKKKLISDLAEDILDNLLLPSGGNKFEIDLDVITAQLDELKDLEARIKFILKQIDKKVESGEMLLGLFLKQNKLINLIHGRFEFGFKEYTRTAFDQQAFKADHEELFNKYKLPKTTERFEFKVI